MAKNTKDTSSRIDLHHTHHHRSDMRWDMGGRQRGQQILSTKNMAQEEGEGRAMVWLHRCCAGATGPRAGRHKERRAAHRVSARRRRHVCRASTILKSVIERPLVEQTLDGFTEWFQGGRVDRLRGSHNFTL